MVVDDGPSVLLLVDVLAEKPGFRVKAVSNGLQAPEQLRDGTVVKSLTQASLAEVLGQYR